jgi:transposase-like protein
MSDDDAGRKERVVISEEDRKEAVESIVAGVSYKDVAEHFGVAVVTVYKWCAEAGLVKNHGKAATLAAIEAYTTTDMSVVDICATHGIGSTALYSALSFRGIPRRTKGRLEGTAAEAAVLELYSEGVPIYEIRQRTHKGYPFVYQTLDKYGIPRRRAMRVLSDLRTVTVRDMQEAEDATNTEASGDDATIQSGD